MAARRASLVAVGIGTGGLLLGHHLNYLFLSPDAREHVLSSTGHGYLGCSSRLVLLGGVISALMLAGSAAICGRRGDRWPGLRGLAARLSALQGAGFLTLEVGERLLSGDVGHHLDPRLLLAGLLIQIVLALALALAAHMLARVAYAVGASLRPAAPQVGARPAWTWPRCCRAPRSFRPDLWRARAPPSFSAA